NKKRRLICTNSNKTIAEALAIMNAHKVGAILLTDESGENIVGIWTERDLMRNVMTEGFDINKAIISDYMTKDLHSASFDTDIHALKEMILSLFIRHILIEKDGRYVGMLSVGDIIRASLSAQDAHIEALKSHTSWHYYESWGWKA
ncbi:MAG: cyclic nucleotide-binding/CBS domain-containing protein, partial [Rhodothermales bacterium]